MARLLIRAGCVLLTALLGAPLAAGRAAAEPPGSPGLDAVARARVVARARMVARAVEGDLVRAVARARQASVAVVSHRGGGQGPRRLGAVGSGVLVAWKGTWVVTSLHVVEGEPDLEVVTADGRSRPVRIRASSRSNDLALLAFDQPALGLHPASLSSSRTTRVREGTWVVATGNPFFLALDGETVASLGVLSGARPPDASAYLDAPTIQHDAEINPGSSGGPLWNRQGELVGINGTIATRSHRQGAGPSHTGASFSVPSAAVRRLLVSALGPLDARSREVAVAAPVAQPAPARGAGKLGANFRTATDAQGRPSGAAVTTVDAGSPVAPRNGRTGLRTGDLVTRFTISGRSYRIRSAADVQVAMSGHPAGTALVLHYQRRGQAHVWSGYLTGS